MSLHTHFRPEITIVEVRGAVDAYNAERLSDHIDDLVTHDRPLIIDLYCVDFFRRRRFPSIGQVAETCQREGVRWTLVTSRAVDWLLYAGDGNHAFPVAASLEEAMQQLTPHKHEWLLPRRAAQPGSRGASQVSHRGRRALAWASSPRNRTGAHAPCVIGYPRQADPPVGRRGWLHTARAQSAVGDSLAVVDPD